MHICYITHEYPKKGFSHGGIGTFLRTISRALVNTGVQVTVVGINQYTGSYEEEMDEGVKIYRLPQKKIKGLTWWLNAKAVNTFLKQLHITQPISIIETPELGLAFIHKIKGIKYVIRTHGGHHFFAEAEKRGINKWKGYQERKSFKKADGFIAVSHYVKDHTSKFLNFEGKPIQIINYAIDTKIEVPNVEVDSNKILFAGTVCDKKGVRQLVEAFKKVREKYPDQKLDLYGRDWFYPNGDSYIGVLKSEYHASYFEHVTFYGSITFEDLQLNYAQANICVFPSHMETQGLVALESMLLKKTVIFSEYGPGPETIEHQKTGLLCDVYNPDDIAKKIIWCVENPEGAKQLGVNAQLVVKKKYDPEIILKKNLEFYNSLISS
ncbi:MAG: glycosyl transferase family 1 [Bacteroidetes bacterium MedPE-SWsnd-G2]|nr:MAG: glycosyl transferase family 1 [Bacteroidetes bacterium MedPE-SWsnd-G2]